MTPVELVSFHHARLTLATFRLAESMTQWRIAEAGGDARSRPHPADIIKLRGDVGEAAPALANALDAVTREYADPK